MQWRNKTCARIDGGAGLGFTIMEVLIAVAVIVVLTVITVPSFQSMKSNIDESSAKNGLSVTLSTARNLAIKGDYGDTAVVFLYDRKTQTYSLIVAALAVSGLENLSPTEQCEFDRADVFVPVEGMRSRRLAGGWEVRALGYGAAVSFGTPEWYAHFATTDADAGWIFPESDQRFFKRQTFMVRYAVGEGVVVTGNAQFHSPDAWLYDNPNVPIETLDLPTAAAAVFERGIHLRAAPALALYSVDDLVAAVQLADINRETGTLYSASYGTSEPGDGSYVENYQYTDAQQVPVTHAGYEAILSYLDENVTPIVFNRFTGTILRSDLR
ncbi:MAG: hypothetical protein KAS72_11915 [Phycisphaerales bacterium]|nr:hypothetical protein [Phycisphaerales bacterium]